MKYTYLLICLSALTHGQLNSKNGLEISLFEKNKTSPLEDAAVDE